jgi:hypothetical protein
MPEGRKDTVIRGFRLFGRAACGGVFVERASPAYYLWVADPRQVPFLCSCKEKEPKETRPEAAENSLRFSPEPALA